MSKKKEVIETIKEVKVEPKKEEAKKIAGFYKGYDIRWLRNEVSHPDFYLVAEFDSL